jgi:hypothetical protein
MLLPSPKKILLTSLAALTIAASTPAQAWDCNADCDQASEASFPCPTLRKPWRKCKGTDHFTRTACLAQKAASCKLWNSAADFATDKLKPHLVGEFNSNSWAAAVEGGETEKEKYMAKCEVAGVMACGILGSYLAGPWGAALSGGLGVFVAWKTCQQSTVW